MTLLLDEQDKEWIAARYVAKNDCDKIIDHQNRKFANDDKRLAVIENNTKIILRVLAAVGVGVLGIFLEMAF